MRGQWNGKKGEKSKKDGQSDRRMIGTTGQMRLKEKYIGLMNGLDGWL